MPFRHKRILCLSDGDDCSSIKTNLDGVAESLKNENIILDVIATLESPKKCSL